MLTKIPQALQIVQSRLKQAAQNADRSEATICLIAVSKLCSVDAINAAYQAGCRDFGENYAQELKAKAIALKDRAITWHFIGALQSNKTLVVAQYANWVHTIDRFHIAQQLSQKRPETLPPLNLCIQVNISKEPQKHGCNQDILVPLAKTIATLPHLRLRGLMCLPKSDVAPDLLRQQFIQLRHLQKQVIQAGIPMDVLSMGMSQDFESAVAEGATHIRIGTAIFGQRLTQSDSLPTLGNLS